MDRLRGELLQPLIDQAKAPFGDDILPVSGDQAGGLGVNPALR